LALKYDLDLPAYPGTDCVVLLDQLNLKATDQAKLSNIQ